jgi:hypothetical protein
MAATKSQRRFLLCVNNAGYPASLDVRKVYATLPDADAESSGFVRVIDESGEDYLYPQELFVAVDLPKAAAEAVLTAPSGGAA